ncbi:MAG TPA: DMT family transporter [Patescibacteria group bacterium]|nr:DMT family transporter [Patescibacteria group bacterium]
MNWIIADLIMFVCSVGVYVAVRKAALDKLPAQFNNLAMFAIPLIVFVIGDVFTKEKLGLTLSQALQILGTGVVLSYLGNAMSMRSIELAPNAGYSLIISKSYVVLTSFLAVPLFGARLTAVALVSISLIIGASALIMINPKAARHAKSAAWVPLALGSFFCWAFLSLMAKHLIAEGISTVVFLTYVFIVATVCILIEMKYKKVDLSVVKKHIWPFVLIGIASTGFNFFNFYAVSIAPNVGYVNATNAASIGAVTALSVILFKDELTKQKLIGVTGVLIGLVALFVWK